MKSKKGYFAIIIFTAALMLMPISSDAAISYGGAWLPNDADFFAIELSPTGGAGALYLYDFDEGTADNLLLVQDGAYNSATVFFTLVNSTWFADTTLGGQALNLGPNQDFGFYFWDGSTVVSIYDLIVINLGEVYQLSADLFGGDGIPDMVVSISDAAPVPIPGALWLLGSGLVGLVAIRRKFKK